MHFCALFPDLFPGAGRDTPISGANLCHQNLLILRCIFSTLCCIFPTLCPPQPRAMFLILARACVLFGKLPRPRLAPRQLVNPSHLCQLGIQRLGQLSQLRPVSALPGVA